MNMYNYSEVVITPRAVGDVLIAKYNWLLGYM